MGWLGERALLEDPVRVLAASAIGWGMMGKIVSTGELIVCKSRRRGEAGACHVSQEEHAG